MIRSDNIKTNVIHNEDCIEGMEKLPNNSVDLIITSPPYNLGNNHHTGNYRHKSYDDDMKETKYQEWQKEVLNECHRVLKSDGSLMYNHKNRIKNGKQITPYEWLLDTKFIIKQEIVWINRSQNFDKIRFYPFTERVYWLAKNENVKLENNINHYDVFDWKEWKPVGTDNEHKRAFPIKMVTDILKCFPQAEVILDPFIGSGTTAVGALLEKRKFIGIEKKMEYVNLTYKRIGKLDKAYYEKLPEKEKPKQKQLF